MRGKAVSFQGFSAGVNYADAPYMLGDKEARDVLNVVSTGRGGVRKRHGSTAFATATLHSLGALTLADGTSFLVGAGGTKLYSINESGTVTDLGVSVTAGAPWEFAQGPAVSGQGPLYAVNGIDVPKQWTGAGSAASWTGTGVPNARFLKYKGTRMWAANMPSGYTPSGGGALDDPKSAVVFSDLGDPHSFPGANVVEFDPGDGEEITGLGAVGSYVLVFKETKAWIIYDLNTGANRPLGEGIGCMGHRSIVEGVDGAYFLSPQQGVLTTTGSGVKRGLSDRVKPLLDQITPAGRSTVTAAYHDDHYLLTFDTANGRRTLDYDIRLDAWYVHDYAPADWQNWEPSGEPQLYAARGTKVERAFVPDATTDAGALISSYWRGPYHAFGAPHVRKRVRRVHFDGKGRIAVALATDFQTNEVSQGEATFLAEGGVFADPSQVFGETGIFGESSTVGEAEVLTPGVARAWSVQFGNNTADSFEVDAYVFLVQTRKA